MARGNWVDRSRPIIRWANRAESLEVRFFGRTLMTAFRPGSVMVIETRGRRTGRRHQVPVAYLPDAHGGFFVGGGAAGMTRTADWVLNLRANPAAIVIVRRRPITVVAAELDGAARQHAHDAASAVWKDLGEYERRSGRPIPYFHLQPDHRR